MQRGNLARARLHFERARRINSDLAQPHHALGVLAERERRPDVAAEHYRDALKVNPGFGPSRANLGRILFGAGRYHEAREQFLRLVEVDPGLLSGRTGLAETLLQLGREDESDAIVDQARDDFGDAPEIALLLARRSIRLGDLAGAESTLLPLTRGRDDHARAAGRGSQQRGLRAPTPPAHSRLRISPSASIAMTRLQRASSRWPCEPRVIERALAWLERAHLLAPHNAVVSNELEKARERRKTR
jgi:Flp pilus assembly protein TadD